MTSERVDGEIVSPVTVTLGSYVESDGPGEGVLVRHDGQIVWRENSWGYIDQYFRFYAPKGPVILTYADEEEISAAELDRSS